MELLSIGTLVAYTKVTISVLVSRFQSGVQSVPENYEGNTGITQWLHNIFSKAKRTQKDQSSGTAYQQITDEEDSCSRPPTPRAEVTEATTFRAEVAVFFLVISLAALAVILSYSFQHVFVKGEWWAIFLLTLFSGAVIVQLFVIQLQPRNSATFPFMVPGVPYISALTIFINAVLMANLQWGTYVRFGVWMMLGACIRSLSSSQCVSQSVSLSVSVGHRVYQLIHSQSTRRYISQYLGKPVGEKVHQSVIQLDGTLIGQSIAQSDSKSHSSSFKTAVS